MHARRSAGVVRDRRAAVVGRRAGRRRRAAGRTRPRAASDSAALGLGQVVVHAVADVEQGARVVDADRGDPRHAGQSAAPAPAGSGRLVERGEDQRLVGRRARMRVGRARRRPPRVDRRRVADDPRARPGPDLVDAGQQRGGLARRPGRRGTATPVGAGGDRAHGGPGEQDVAGVVEPGDEHGAAHQSPASSVVRPPAQGRPRGAGPPRPRAGGSTGVGTRIAHGPGGRPRPRRRRRCRRRPRSAPGRRRARRRRPLHHAGRGLAAGAAVVGPVRADLPACRSGPSSSSTRALHAVDLLGGDDAAGDAGLVAHHADAHPARAQPVQRLLRAVDRPHPVGSPL